MSSTTVYLIDDEPVCLQTMGAVIKALGYECITYQDGTELVDALTSHGELSQPGIILADFRLPSMNGLQLFQKTRALGCELPFVLISGHADKDLVDTSLQAGVTSFLQKPIDFERLGDTIESLVS